MRTFLNIHTEGWSKRLRPWCLLVPLFFMSCAPPASTPRTGTAPTSGSYLFLWAGDSAKAHSDFLAVVDADPASPRYTQIVASMPVRATGTSPHHTEAELHSSGFLFANGFGAGRTWIFDVRDPLSPRVAAQFEDHEGFSHPHSFLRLGNGNVLATFQYRAGDHDAPGGLVEIDNTGTAVRRSRPADNLIDRNVRPYSVAVLPPLDRAVTTTTDMHGRATSRAVQIWRLSDLELLHTIELPIPEGRAGAHATAEPRVMDDGRTVLVNTFTCGLYRLTGVETESPSAEIVYMFPGARCAVPLLIGRFWVQTLQSENAVAVLDLSDLDRPVEVSRLTFAEGEQPHWLSYDRASRRIVVTGYRALQHRVVVLHFDPVTGRITWDDTFREAGSQRPGITFDRSSWPHGSGGPAIPHGAVFGRVAHQSTRHTER